MPGATRGHRRARRACRAEGLARASTILGARRTVLDAVAAELLERETLERNELEQIVATASEANAGAGVRSGALDNTLLPIPRAAQS